MKRISRHGHYGPRRNMLADPVSRPCLAVQRSGTTSKGQGMAHLTQHDCNRIARHLNRRPRKRLGYRTPEECYAR